MGGAAAAVGIGLYLVRGLCNVMQQWTWCCRSRPHDRHGDGGHGRPCDTIRQRQADGSRPGPDPRQHRSGGKERLLGFSKRGDAYLRMLLIHGARSMIRPAGSNSIPNSEVQL